MQYQKNSGNDNHDGNKLIYILVFGVALPLLIIGGLILWYILKKRKKNLSKLEEDSSDDSGASLESDLLKNEQDENFKDTKNGNISNNLL